MTERYTLHEDPVSGNCYKITLTAALLGIPLERVRYDILAGETRTPAFLGRVNPEGRIPVLQIGAGDGARFLPESNAACWYLADGSHLVPTDRYARADMLRWMFFEQSSHEPNVATLRFWRRFIGEDNLSPYQAAQVMQKETAGHAALKLMDDRLSQHDWFAGGAVSLADIALFAYTHVAAEAGFELCDYPAIETWLERVRNLRDFVPMT